MQIGAYTFGLAPKDSLNFDLSREVFKLDTVGVPTYQDMGIAEKTLQFSGSIIGVDAWVQLETLESIMDAGLPQTLLYGPIQRTVRIASITPKLKRFDRVDYDLSLTVIPPKSGYNAPQQQAQSASTPLPTKTPPATTSTESIAQYMDKTYTVRQGDTLWGIAQRTLGTGATAVEIQALINSIAKANQITNINAISSGQKLKIPSTAANVNNANTAYTARQTAVVTTVGVSYLQTQEAAGRFKAVAG